MANLMDQQALRSKANELLSINDFQGAKELLGRLAQALPADSEVWCDLGRTSMQLGDVQSAIVYYQRAVNLAPQFVNAQYGLAMALGQSGALTQAQRHLEQVVRIDTSHVDARVKIAYIEYMRGHISAAMYQLKEAQRLSPMHPELHLQLGLIYIAQGEFNKAEKCFKISLREDPGNQEALTQMATLKAYSGDPSEAYQILAPLLRPETVYVSAAILFANFCRPLGRCKEAKVLLETLLSRPITAESEGKVHFALGKLHEREGDYQKAFECFDKGNKVYDASFDPWKQKTWVREVVRQLDRDFFSQAAHARNLSKRIRPVFIVGMPRSGTSLVEQILSSHPEVYGAGERMEIDEIASLICSDIDSKESYPFCLSAGERSHLTTVARRYIREVSVNAPDNARIVTDKMPGNFHHLGLIQLLFPKARVIHCVRDPMDTCLSCYTNRLMGHAYSYDLTNLGRYYRLYEELMDHWKNTLSLSIMDVRYENLVDEPETMSRAIIEFCGLKWSSRCLNFHKSRRNVVTASTDQVRQPIYRESVARWKNYEEYLGNLCAALNERI